MKRALVLYVPVLHAGYVRLLEKYLTRADEVWVLGNGLVSELMPLHKEIRALPPAAIKKSIEALGLAREVRILEKNNAKELARRDIVIADDETTHAFLAKYLPKKRAKTERVFLRWDEKNVLAVQPVRSRNGGAYSRKDTAFMARAEKLAGKSSDWWRQVGAVVTRGGRVIAESYNHHVPSEHIQYIEGDPRDFVKAGTRSEISTALHAEQRIVSDAARRGLKLEGANMYVTSFPCAVCAKLVANAGIKKCFFKRGFASLDGERIMKEQGIELIRIK